MRVVGRPSRGQGQRWFRRAGSSACFSSLVVELGGHSLPENRAKFGLAWMNKFSAAYGKDKSDTRGGGAWTPAKKPYRRSV